MYLYHADDAPTAVEGLSKATSELNIRIGRRDNSGNDPNAPNVYPVSQMQKTVIPVVISLLLFLVAFLGLFFLVRRKRKQNEIDEREEQRRKRLDDLDNDHDDDDDLELSPAHRKLPQTYTQEVECPPELSRPEPAVMGRGPAMQQMRPQGGQLYARPEQREANVV